MGSLSPVQSRQDAKGRKGATAPGCPAPFHMRRPALDQHCPCSLQFLVQLSLVLPSCPLSLELPPPKGHRVLSISRATSLLSSKLNDEFLHSSSDDQLITFPSLVPTPQTVFSSGIRQTDKLGEVTSDAAEFPLNQGKGQRRTNPCSRESVSCLTKAFCGFPSESLQHHAANSN